VPIIVPPNKSNTCGREGMHYDCTDNCRRRYIQPAPRLHPRSVHAHKQCECGMQLHTQANLLDQHWIKRGPGKGVPNKMLAADGGNERSTHQTNDSHVTVIVVRPVLFCPARVGGDGLVINDTVWVVVTVVTVPAGSKDHVGSKTAV